MGKHRVTMIVDLAPEAVPHLPAEAVLPASLREAPDSPDLIDETFVSRSAADTYADAMDGPEADDDSPTSRGAAKTIPAIPVSWGSGTSGWPRCGSRALRICHGSPERFSGFDGEGVALQLDSDPHETAEGLWLTATGTLSFSSFTRPVRVELRLHPFGGRYTLAEIRLLSKGRYPRRFFRAAHDVLAQLPEASLEVAS